MTFHAAKYKEPKHRVIYILEQDNQWQRTNLHKESKRLKYRSAAWLRLRRVYRHLKTLHSSTYVAEVSYSLFCANRGIIAATGGCLPVHRHQEELKLRAAQHLHTSTNRRKRRHKPSCGHMLSSPSDTPGCREIGQYTVSLLPRAVLSLYSPVPVLTLSTMGLWPGSGSEYFR